MDGAAEVSTEETLNLRHGEVEMLGSIPKCRSYGGDRNEEVKI